MNELMQKITEKLSISIDKIPEVYEGLKWQYIVWEACDSMSWVFGIAALFATPFFIVLMFNWITTNWEWQKERDRLKYKKFLKISIFIFIIIALFSLLFWEDFLFY